MQGKAIKQLQFSTRATYSGSVNNIHLISTVS